MKKLCNNGDFLVLDKAYLHNNLWGEKKGIGTQCSWVESFDKKKNNILWKTNWNWSANESLIKSYASIVYGWHWGWKVNNVELPMKIEEIKEIKTSWEFDIEEKNQGNVNITYDIWFSNRIITEENPDGELMIWLYKNGEVPPIGQIKREIEIFETKWELWEGLHPEHNWPVFSFIRKENIEKVNFDISFFIDELKKDKCFNFMYLLSIQSGIEVLSGSGNLETREYTIEIKRK